MKTKKFRMTVVISIVYSVFVLLILGEEEYWDLDDMVLPFAVFTAPVWIFWSSVWVSPERFERFFNPDLKKNGTAQEKWVYVSEKVARTHKYYGISGWAFFLAFSIAAGFPISAFMLFSFIDVISDIMKVAVILELSLSVFVFYALVTHNIYFQKIFIITYVILVMLFGGIAIYSNYLDPRSIADMIRGLIWMVYVIRSKRINITTRHRFRRGDENLIVTAQNESSSTNNEKTPASKASSEELNYNLLKAVMHENTDKVIELMRDGADPYARNSLGYSAIDYARGHGYSHIERILKNA